MAMARLSRGRKYGMGRRVALKVMVLGVVGLMSLAGTNPAMAATNQDNGSFWTQFTPSADTRLIFVSSSEGNDSNNGLTPATPVKTLARAESLLRNGFPDWMLLKRGDIWDHMLPFWSKSGRSETEMMVVGAYGDGGQRPKIMPPATAAGAIRAQGNSETKHVAFVGLHLEPSQRADDQQIAGVVWLRRSRNILFEDLYVSGFKDGFSVQSLGEVAPVEDIRINGCVVVDSWSKMSHSQGLYADRVNGLVIENSVFASNGFDLGRNAQPTIFNHNIYIQNGTREVIIRGNIIADASSHGVQLRPGGIVEDNLFISNPISVLLGGGTNPDEGGVEGSIGRNLIMYGRSISQNTPRSFGIDVSNIRAGTVSDNILYSSEIGPNGNAITVANSGEYGISDLQIIRNSIINWHGTIAIAAPPEGHVRRDIRLQHNLVCRDLTANGGNPAFNKPMVSSFVAGDAALQISGNRYRYFGMHDRPFRLGSLNFSVGAWASQIEPDGDFQSISQPVSGYGIDGYLAAIGREGGLGEFMVMARSQSRQSFDADIVSTRVYQWVAERLQNID